MSEETSSSDSLSDSPSSDTCPLCHRELNDDGECVTHGTQQQAADQLKLQLQQQRYDSQY